MLECISTRRERTRSAGLPGESMGEARAPVEHAGPKREEQMR
jgi:hypothetical protein